MSEFLNAVNYTACVRTNRAMTFLFVALKIKIK